jgi:hypothetical protein
VSPGPDELSARKGGTPAGSSASIATHAPSASATSAVQASLSAAALQLLPIMVLMKDFVLLACDALEDAGCPPAPLLVRVRSLMFVSQTNHIKDYRLLL